MSFMSIVLDKAMQGRSLHVAQIRAWNEEQTPEGFAELYMRAYAEGVEIKGDMHLDEATQVVKAKARRVIRRK
jgi:wyosine [tRNA(Phe)-imidazoG37] synthetase (radical SAM superfamily)